MQLGNLRLPKRFFYAKRGVRQAERRQLRQTYPPMARGPQGGVTMRERIRYPAPCPEGDCSVESLRDLNELEEHLDWHAMRRRVAARDWRRTPGVRVQQASLSVLEVHDPRKLCPPDVPCHDCARALCKQGTHEEAPDRHSCPYCHLVWRQDREEMKS